MKLVLRAVVNSVVGLVVLGAAIFIPAGTLAYWRGWAFIAAFTFSTNVIGFYLARKDPALLERRMKAGPRAETRPRQKVLIALTLVSLPALLCFSALDYRFGWSNVPGWVSGLGAGLVVLGLMIDLRVFRENTYGASTIETMEGQRVIDTGPYALVRHPMYVGVVVMVVGMPLSLGSYWGLLFLLLTVPILMLRVLDEEAMLREELDGYVEYTARVRYRLLPGLW